MKFSIKRVVGWAISVCFVVSLLSANAKESVIEGVFKQHGASGTLVLQRLNSEAQTIYNPKRAQQRYSPASTFKIPNTLIALARNVVSSPESIFKWDGQQRWLEAWNKDQTLQSAFQVSCVWCYQHLAVQLGRDSYQQDLAKLAYGNQRLGDQIDLFWLDNSLRISAIEQTEFLMRLINNDLPFPIHLQKLTKQVMLAECNDEFTLYAKSGWAARGLNIGWYVGYIEKKGEVWVFAMNMDLDDFKRAPLRKAIVMQALAKLGVIEPI